MVVSKESVDIKWMATMNNLDLYLNSMDVTGMDVLLIFQTETEFNIISVRPASVVYTDHWQE